MIQLKNVTRTFSSGEGIVRALNSVDLTIGATDFVTVTGPSGCGKSTLLNILGGLDRPSSGEVWVDTVPLHSADEAAMTHYRRQEMGIVFQFFNLLPSMKVVENIELPLLLQGISVKESRSRALELLDLVGLTHRKEHFPGTLSGGEMQRTAIARALVHRPKLVLADEPTGNLDSKNADAVLELFLKIASQRLAAMIIVTHSESVAALAPRQIEMLDGKIKT